MPPWHIFCYNLVTCTATRTFLSYRRRLFRASIVVNSAPCEYVYDDGFILVRLQLATVSCCRPSRGENALHVEQLPRLLEEPRLVWGATFVRHDDAAMPRIPNK